jgi:hypothetical protein
MRSPAIQDIPPKNWWHCMAADVASVTVVTVKEAEEMKFYSNFFSKSIWEGKY